MTSAAAKLRANRAEVPHSLVPSVTQAQAILRSHGSHQMSFGARELSEGGDSLISILGKRGSGKTTLLAAIARTLEENNEAIVLPIVRPDIFEATDSLLLAILLDLELWLSSSKPEAYSGTLASDDLGGNLNAALRAASASTSGAYHALGAGHETSGQYGIDAVAILRHRSRLHQSLIDLFGSVRSHLRHKTTVPIIVPIDDADLSPANIRSILAAIRLLGSLPNIIPIMCADRDQLEISIRADIHNQYAGHINESDCERLAVQVVSKLLRPERCLSPPRLSLLARSQFTPIGEEVSLRRLLRGEAPKNGHTMSLSGLIWDGSPATEGLLPDGVNAWLPETPRELEYLWLSARALLSTASARDVSGLDRPAQRFVDHILDSSREFSIAVESRDISTDERPTGNRLPASEASVALAWPNLLFGVSTRGRFASAVSNNQLRLRVRRLARMRVNSFPTISPAGAADSSEGRREISPAAVSSVQALQELQLSGLLGPSRPAAPSVLGEGEFEFLQSVTVHGQDTDDFFLSMPDSCGVQDMTRAAIAWNHLVEFARESNRSHEDLGASVVLRRFVQVIIRYWLNEDERVLKAKRLPSWERTMDLASLQYLKSVSADTVSHLDHYTRSRSYASWFERRLPYLFHSVVIGEAQCQRTVEMWLDAISAGPRAVEATGDLRSALELRFDKLFDEERRRRNGEHSWIYGYHALAKSVGTELYADTLMLKESFEERRRSRSVGRDILGDSLGLTTTKGHYQFVPHRTIEGDEEMTVLREVLEQYRSRQ